MRRDCRMKLAGVSKKVMDLLNVTRLAMAFDIVDRKTTPLPRSNNRRADLKVGPYRRKSGASENQL